ncbi:MAG: hypothetical protein HZB14_00540 [Actinobacteria bacterium]|nr:hypothetical protein [Actinomycetota bacterium]
MNADGRRRRTIDSVTDSGKRLPCFKSLSLVAITESKRTIANQVAFERSAGGQCNPPRTVVRTISSDRRGSRVRLSSASLAPRRRELRSFPSREYLFAVSQIVMDATDRWLVRFRWDSQSIALTDRITGARTVRHVGLMPDVLQVWEDGAVLAGYHDYSEIHPNDLLWITPSQSAPVELLRDGASSRFQRCGNAIINVYWPQSPPGVEQPRLAVHDRSGALVRDVAESLPASATLEDCDGETALFSTASPPRLLAVDL